MAAEQGTEEKLTQDAWQQSARLDNWDVCGADYTPPQWCDSLPEQVAIDHSFTQHRKQLVRTRESEAKRMVKAAEKFERRIQAAANVKKGVVRKADLQALSNQAKEGDAEAMELLAWMYVKGMMPETTRDLDANEAAYIWYGRAYLAGATEVKPEMDKIWPTLSVTQQRRIVALFDSEQASK